jgi:hypothetical protein
MSQKGHTVQLTRLFGLTIFTKGERYNVFIAANATGWELELGKKLARCLH